MKLMSDDIVVTLDNNPGLEAKIATLEDQVTKLQYEVSQWRHRCTGYEVLLLKLYREG